MNMPSITLQHVQQSTQQTSAISELDLPQSGSEDDDETWLTEPNGCKTTSTIKVAAEVHSAAEAYSVAKNPFHQHSKTQPVAEPDLPKTTIVTRGRDLPGPQSQDDDEDSSPIVQELDRAEHTQCSSNNHPTLMPSRGASALGSEESPLVTPASPRQNAKLTSSTEKARGENAKLTVFCTLTTINCVK